MFNNVIKNSYNINLQIIPIIVPEKENPASLPRSTGGAQVAHKEAGAGIANPEAIPIINLWGSLEIYRISKN